MRVERDAAPGVVKGKLNSVPDEGYLLQFFSNPKGNEGKKFLNSKTVFAGAAGNASFTFTSSKEVKVGQNVTETATRVSTEDTSEFSPARKVATSRMAGVPFGRGAKM